MSTSKHSNIVAAFKDRFDAKAGVDLDNEFYDQPELWVGSDTVVCIVSEDTDSVGEMSLEDTETPESVYRSNEIKTTYPITEEMDVVIVSNGEMTHVFSQEYIDPVLDLIDEEIEYLADNSETRFDMGDGFPLCIHADEYTFVVAPRMVPGNVTIDDDVNPVSES